MISPLEPFDGAAVALLAHLPSWRLRAVERIEFSKAFWSEREREIHVQPLKQAMQEDIQVAKALRKLGTRSGDSIELVLPITEFPKVPLLDLNITVNGEEVSRLSRDESARVQAHYLRYLGEQAGLFRTPPDNLINLLTFAFYFPHEPYQTFWKKHSLCISESLYTRRDTAREYLRREMGNRYGFNVEALYEEWHRLVRPIPRLAMRYTSLDPLSGTQLPLISLPYFYREMQQRAAQGKIPRIPGPDELRNLLEYLADLLFQAQAKAAAAGGGQQTAFARRFLSTYFAYGHRWVAMARCKVPISRPFIIRTEAKRAIYFTPNPTLGNPGLWRQIRKEAWQMVPFADAETNHVTIRVSDTAVRLGNPTVLDESRKRINGPVDEQEHTFELYFRQDSTRGRNERILIKCPLRLTRLHSMMLYLTMAITAFGIYLLVNRGLSAVGTKIQSAPGEKESLIDNGLTAKDAALILVPVAFAASFLLIKDSSTLSMWLRKIRQSILLAELFLLLATAFALLLIHHVKTD